MLKVADILEYGELQGEGSPYIRDGFVMKHSGGLYPFVSKGMLNPLDPVNLILCWHLGVDFSGCDSGVETVLDTMLAVTRCRKTGFTVMTRYKSGAARTVKLDDGTEKVVILGDYAKEKRLILPILSTQLSDKYDQSSIPLWSSLGFRTPPHYGICCNENTYSVDGWHGSNLLEGSDTITYYNIIGGGKKVTVKKTHRDAQVQSVSDEMDRDWDYGNIEVTNYEVTVKPFNDEKPTLKAGPFHKTTPKYVWQDKGEDDDT